MSRKKRAKDLGIPTEVFDGFGGHADEVTVTIEDEDITFSPMKVVATLSSGLLEGTDEELLLAGLLLVFFRTRDWDSAPLPNDPAIAVLIDWVQDENTLAPDVARYFREMGQWTAQPEEGQHR